MKSFPRFSLLVVAMLFVVAATHAAPATQPDDSGTTFMRFVQDADGHARLEIADVAYRNDAGVTVHLIGAVHIADPAFYDGLNESFRHYDALLYEMVKPKDSPAPEHLPAEAPKPAPRAAGQRKKPQGASGHWIGTMQRIMKDRLKLAYQLDGIDYRAPNFVHADLDWETFNQLQDQRGESFATLFFPLRGLQHGQGRRRQGAAGDRRHGAARRTDEPGFGAAIEADPGAGVHELRRRPWRDGRQERVGAADRAQQGRVPRAQGAGRRRQAIPRRLLRRRTPEADGADAERHGLPEGRHGLAHGVGHPAGASGADRLSYNESDDQP